MSDLISRQEAIESLGEEPMVWNDEYHEIAEREQWRRDVAAIEAVPSAEPQTLCEDCKHFRRWVDTNTCFCDITEVEMLDDDYCSRAERRTDEKAKKN